MSRGLAVSLQSVSHMAAVRVLPAARPLYDSTYSPSEERQILVTQVKPAEGVHAARAPPMRLSRWLRFDAAEAWVAREAAGRYSPTSAGEWNAVRVLYFLFLVAVGIIGLSAQREAVGLILLFPLAVGSSGLLVVLARPSWGPTAATAFAAFSLIGLSPRGGPRPRPRSLLSGSMRRRRRWD